MFLLDTNVCLDFALGRSEAVRLRVLRSYADGIAISAITLAELRVGARRTGGDLKDDQRLDKLIGTLTVHDFDGRAADEYGVLAQRIGVQRSSFDRLIAAHALSLGLTLVTNNVLHFADIPGLAVENWTLPL